MSQPGPSRKETDITYDVRTVDRNLRKGIVARKDYDKYLKALPDATDKAQVAKPDESPIEPNDYDDRLDDEEDDENDED